MYRGKNDFREDVHRKKREPEALAGIVKGVLEELERADLKAVGVLFSRWKEMVGEPLNLHTFPHKVSRKKLHILVDSSSWLFEIKTQWKDEILRRVQEKVGGQVVKDLIFTVGQLEDFR